MAKFNSAKMIGADDKGFQQKYNELIDLLDTGYVVESMRSGKHLKIQLNSDVGLKMTVDGDSIFSIDPVTGRVVIGYYDDTIGDLDDVVVKQEVSYQGVVIDATNGFISTATIGGETTVVKLNSTDGLSFYNGTTYAGGVNVRSGSVGLETVGSDLSGGKRRMFLDRWSLFFDSSPSADPDNFSAGGWLTFADVGLVDFTPGYEYALSEGQSMVLTQDSDSGNVIVMRDNKPTYQTKKWSTYGYANAFYGGVNVYSGNLNVERGILTIDGKRALTAKATGSATIDPVSMAGQTGLTLSTITATGAALGDFVLVSSSADTEELTVTASVISANTVEIRLYNGKASTAVDLPSSTWRVLVIGYA